ncbi:hypothetical protein G6L46_30415 [Agrobacterium rhizogenes]|uniref:endonuclease/exonuclease/phosphatase family protein n=1 Tax=Rhizobium rhizogenes TaxID=359 RepID=UPI001571684A|nr:endonuclease/exonuclease/phosphatase family protein [Rhizobium rhizogenes]NTF91484.1 hypothetical protein [Rhizobium rhizogenes]
MSFLEVLTYNVRAEYDATAWKRRSQTVARVLNESPFDIIAVQEATEHMIADYQAALPSHHYVVGERSDGHRGDQGWYEYNPIFYNPDRFERLMTGSFWVGEDPARPGDTLVESKWHGRVFNWLVVRERTTGRRLAIGNVHIHGPKGERGVELITCALRTHAQGSEIILLGDFNSTPNTVAYERMTGPDDLRFVDAMLAAEQRSGGEATVIGVDQFIPTGLDGEGQRGCADRIDYVFVDPSIAVKSYRIVDSAISDNVFASDHFPISVSLELSAKAPSNDR